MENNDEKRGVQAAPDPETQAPPGRQAKAKRRKELPEEELIRRRKRIVIPAFVLVFLAVLYWIFAPSGEEGAGTPGGSGFNVNVPEPVAARLEDDKKEAYERQRAEQEKGRRMQSLSSLAERLLERKPEDDTVPDGNGHMERSADTYLRIADQLDSFYEPPEGGADGAGLERKVEDLTRRLEEAEEENRRAGSREEMMERSYRLAAKYLNPSVSAAGEEEGEDAPEPVPVSRAESRTASMLGQAQTDSAFIASLAVERNYGFNTAVGSGYRTAANTIGACIAEGQTLGQSGRVKLRLLQPLQAGNVTVPANSLITGTADIKGERMDILVSSIGYAGNIIPVELAVYDTDGQRGIFVPGSESRTAAKEAAGDVSRSMGNSISFAGSAGQQVAMDLTRGLLQGGTQFISEHIRAVKVRLKAGYKVLLVAKEQ